MTFHDLHDGDQPLVLPNAWDYASAAALVAAGFPAVGTTSLGVAVAAGLPDGTGATRAETTALAARLTRLPCPVSVDIEGGFSEDPGEVAAFVRELAEMGVAGVNIEDGRDNDALAPVTHQVRVIQAVKEAAPELFVNARTDTHWLKAAPLTEALDRVRAYADAGADGVFVPALATEPDIEAVVAAVAVPVNVLFSPTGPDITRLARLGVRRVSMGSLLFRAALHTVVQTALAPGAVPPGIPGYAEAAALVPS